MTVRGLLEESTPAPWRPCAHVAGTDSDCTCNYAGDIWDPTGERVVFYLGPVCEHGGPLPSAVSDDSRRTGYANGMLVCLMRSAFPEMLDALEYIASDLRGVPGASGRRMRRAQEALASLVRVAPGDGVR